MQLDSQILIVRAAARAAQQFTLGADHDRRESDPRREMCREAFASFHGGCRPSDDDEESMIAFANEIEDAMRDLLRDAERSAKD